jgi:hypothetical protein
MFIPDEGIQYSTTSNFTFHNIKDFVIISGPHYDSESITNWSLIEETGGIIHQPMQSKVERPLLCRLSINLQ